MKTEFERLSEVNGSSMMEVCPGDLMEEGDGENIDVARDMAPVMLDQLQNILEEEEEPHQPQQAFCQPPPPPRPVALKGNQGKDEIPPKEKSPEKQIICAPKLQEGNKLTSSKYQKDGQNKKEEKMKESSESFRNSGSTKDVENKRLET